MNCLETGFDEWLEVKEEKLPEDLAALIEIPSVANHGTEVTKACTEVLKRMQEIAEREGFETDDVDGHCLGAAIGHGETEIGIWSHLDVVPPGDGWIYPPYQCTVKDGYLIGRGVQDNKGPAIAVFYALCYCKEQGLLNHIRVKQIFGSQEECGMQDVAYYLAKRKAPDYSFVADCGFPVCCGEKGILRVTFESELPAEGIVSLQSGTVCNSVPSCAEAEIPAGAAEGCGLQPVEEGMHAVKITADGISGHAAFPDGTKNAAGVLCRKLEQYALPERTKGMLSFLEALADGGYGEKIGIGCEDTVSGRLTCNLGVLSLKDGKICAEIDIRYPVTVQTEDFWPKLQKAAGEAGFAAAAVSDDPPHYMEGTHPFVQTLMAAWQETTGKTGRPFVMGGGTYARKIPNAVAFGPGADQDLSVLHLPDGHGNCHCADEAQKIGNLKSAAKIYVNALVKLDRWIAESR